jgi:pyruvate dehydrogenase E1 component beta subunit
MSATTDRAGTAVMTYREALRLALREELSRDDRVFLMGEEVELFEGSYKVTAGLLDEFGPDRVRDTPISEEGFGGAGVGAAMLGERPGGRAHDDQLPPRRDGPGRQPRRQGRSDVRRGTALSIGHPRAQRGGQPTHGATLAELRRVVCRHAGTEGRGAGEPGRRQGTAEGGDPRRRPRARHENLRIYTEKGAVPLDPEHTTPIGLARVVRQGSDITIVAHGYATVRALAVAERLATDGVAAEVVDLRSLRPLDVETVVASVAKTNRALCVEEGWPSYGVQRRTGRPHPEGVLRRPRRAGRARRHGRGASSLRQEPRARVDSDRAADRGRGAAHARARAAHGAEVPPTR